MNQRGQSLVEFALALPVLLLVILGIAELGLFFNAYIDMIDATREGARFGTDLDPEHQDTIMDCASTTDFGRAISCLTQGDFHRTLNKDNGYDDIVVTAYSLYSGQVSITFPSFSLYGNQVSRFTPASIRDMVQKGPCAQGIVIIELFYAHKQLLGLPFFTVFVPDPIQLYAYSIFPNGTALSMVHGCP